MKKILCVLALCCLLSGGILFASGGQETTGGDTAKPVISWASWALAEEALKPIYMSMVDAFVAENPDVKVDTVAYPYAQYKDQMIILASAGNAPDVAHIKEEWVAPLKELNSLLPLNDYLSQESLKDYFPEVLKGVTFDGKILCAPWFNNPYAMFYNKTLMEKAGVKNLPTNWDELMAAARKISALGTDEKGNKIYGYAQPNSKTETGIGYNFFPVMWAFGGDFSNQKGEIVLNTPQNVAAFTMARELYADQISPNGSNFKDLRNLFAQGVIGFYYDIEMGAAPIKAASPKGAEFAKEFSSMIIPSKTGPNGSGYLMQHHLAVFSSCKEKKTAVRYAEFMSKEKVLQILYDAGMGKMPARASVLNLPIFKNPANPFSKGFIAALPYAKPLPTANKNFVLADEAITDALTLAAISKDSIEKIVKDLDARVKELYGQK